MTLYTQGDWLAEHPDLNRLHDAAWRQRVSGWRHAGAITFSADTVMWLIDQVWEMTRQRNDLMAQAAEFESALRQALGLIEGNLESTARDIINGTAGGNDIYDDAEQIKAAILQALGETQPEESGHGQK